ncbi:MAG: hypothetical protein AB1352_02465 [Patescibacteria group bacterium]
MVQNKRVLEDEQGPMQEAPGVFLPGAERDVVREGREKPVERVMKERPGQEQEMPQAGSPFAVSAAPAVLPVKSAQYQRIESILEEDLGDLYFQMDEAHRKLFKEEGEKAVREIDRLISAAKVTVARVLYLIRRWLMLIPGVNKFFLEQEAKIKTDKVMKIIHEKSQ